jgi:hypothetical protein
MSIKRSSRALVATLVAASVGATPALATVGPVDSRSPDAKDAAAKAAVIVDKRSPDVIDAATGGARDLRVTSSLAGPPQFPKNTLPLAPPPAPAPAPAGDGFDVGSAAIGAGGAAVVVIVMAGGIVAIGRRRRIAATA